ncbi:MAG: [Fe-S]-binding protein [Nitrospinota bacterium]|nr:MAG: [Fe-S]-binding protein [Nitrospinota bacterium]
MLFPKMLRIKQKFPAPVVSDIPGTVKQELARINLPSRIRPGDSVALTAGSRGIANIATVMKATAEFLLDMGAKPFIIPAMGSHGGGTAEGQLDVLRHYGITEQTMGVPLRATMEVVQIGETPDHIPVFLDKYASEADHIGVINRIKPHTDFNGEIESGLFKMMAIGLGKHHGAIHYHKANIEYGYYHVILTVGREVLKQAPVAFGLGILENGYDETAKIVAVLPEEMEAVEKALQAEAKRLLARLPFEFAHLLIVDEMGKNISGTGMDTNVIGRIMNLTEKPPEKPRIIRIYVRDLTPETYGNATGVGLADFVSQRLAEKIDRKPTYINCLTGVSPESARIPMILETDREALEAALSTVGMVKPEESKILWIKNTLVLGELEVSEAYLEEVQAREDLEIVREPTALEFDQSGNLLPRFA